MAPTPFIVTGKHHGSDKCDVIIEQLRAAENSDGADDQPISHEPAIHMLNARVYGENVLMVQAYRSTASIRPTSTTIHQDGVTVTGFMTSFDATDDHGNGRAIHPATFVRARLTYHRG